MASDHVLIYRRITTHCTLNHVNDWPVLFAVIPTPHKADTHIHTHTLHAHTHTHAHTHAH